MAQAFEQQEPHLRLGFGELPIRELVRNRYSESLDELVIFLSPLLSLRPHLGEIRSSLLELMPKQWDAARGYE
jgi:hypothetical protein